MSDEKAATAPSLEERVAQLERMVDVLGTQLQLAQRMLFCMHIVPPYSERLPVPGLQPNSVKIVDVPCGFNILMREGHKIGANKIITANGKGH